MERVNEQSTAYLTVTFQDKDGDNAAPSTVSYRIDDVATGTEVRDDTTVTAAASVEITLTPADNTLLTTGVEDEYRRVTVTATYGAGDECRGQYVYRLTNLRKVT